MKYKPREVREAQAEVLRISRELVDLQGRLARAIRHLDGESSTIGGAIFATVGRSAELHGGILQESIEALQCLGRLDYDDPLTAEEVAELAIDGELGGKEEG